MSGDGQAMGDRISLTSRGRAAAVGLGWALEVYRAIRVQLALGMRTGGNRVPGIHGVPRIHIFAILPRKKVISIVGIGALSFIAIVIYLSFTNNQETVAKWPVFFPGNDRILYTYCPEKSRCTLAIYHVAANLHRLMPKPDNQSWSGGSLSPDGSTIAFSLEEEGSRDVGIAIMNVGGTDVHRITAKGDHDRYEGAPTFSPDGRRVIFFRAEFRYTGVNHLTGRDIFIVDIETGVEKQVTDFEFFELGRPFFMPDGKTVAFSAYGPRKVNKLGFNSSSEFSDKYRLEHNDNEIFIVDQDMSLSDRPIVLRPSLYNGESSTIMSVSSSGEILFISRTNKIDEAMSRHNYDLFVTDRGAFRRLTNARSVFSEGAPETGGYRFIQDAAISPDGSRVIFTEHKDYRRRVFWLMDSYGSAMRRIDVPRNLTRTG